MRSTATRDGEDRRAVDRHVVPQPRHQRVAQLHEDAAEPQHLERRHRRRVRAGPDRVHPAMEACSASATTTTTPRPTDRERPGGHEQRPVRAHRQPVERPGRRDLAADLAQSYWVSWSNGYNPSGELGVYGATVDQPQRDQPEPGSRRRPTTTSSADSGTSARRCACARRSSGPRKPTRATPIRGRHRQAARQAPRRRRGDRARGQHHAKWDIYSGVAYMDGKIIESDPLTEGKHMTVAPWSGSVWTVYRFGGDLVGWQVGGGASARPRAGSTTRTAARSPTT